jgi:uncharacterized protein CbrC (UPF0167 family)
MELPKFKYSPNAYKIDVFKEEEGECSICNQQRSLKYTSSFYSVDEPAYICPWCIADGSAAREYEGEFNDAGGVERPLEYDSNKAVKASFDTQVIEIAERTPSYVSWQQEVWLSHCNEPCAFMDYADSKAIQPILHELEDDINNAGYDTTLITEHLSKQGSLVGYLFKCLHCGTHRLHIDSD